MMGTPGNLRRDDSRSMRTNSVSLDPKHGDCAVFFNRGIISTQAIARAFRNRRLAAEYGGPEKENRRARRSDPRTLVGGLEGGVLQLLDRADKDGGERYCATYELSDPDLIKHLTALGKKKLHLVLSDAGEDTEDGSGDGDSTNTDAWSELHSLGLDVDDRMLKKGPIGHNKFVVYVDANGTVAEAYAAHVLDVRGTPPV
jgi:hypothetical protein